MQQVQTDKRTLNAAFIPLEGGGPLVAGGRGTVAELRDKPGHTYRQHRQYCSNYYNRTKRKRESSSCSNGNCSNRAEGEKGKPVVNGTGELEDLPPWVDPLYPYSRGIIGLHEEIEDFYQWMVPSPEEHGMRQGVVDKIQRCIQTVWPAAQVHIFGSFKTGLYLSTSDIDLVVVGRWEVLPLKTLEKALLDQKIADPSMLKVLDKASVPIIKLTDRDSKVKVDISFNMASGLKAVELIKMYKKEFPPLPKLIYVLKQFLLQRDLNEVFTGGLSSYCLIMMVVSFLQLHPRTDAADTAANLGVLLIEFFELYGRSFNYTSTAIRVRGDGSYLPKEQMEMDMPGGQKPSLLCIEDPLQQGNDVGKSSYGALQVRQAFDWAYGQLSRSVSAKGSSLQSPSTLSKILKIDSATIEYREWVKKRFPVPSQNEDTAPPTPPLVTPRVTPSTPYVNLSTAESLRNLDRGVESLGRVLDRGVDSLDQPEEENLSSVSTASCRSNMSSSSDTELHLEEPVDWAEDGRSTDWAEQQEEEAWQRQEEAWHPAPSTPSSAMSVSPASSEVGARPSKRITGSMSGPNPQAGPFRAPFPKRGYTQWTRKPRDIGPDRADLDLNWRASASGPASDRSSNSGGSEKGSEKGSVHSVNGSVHSVNGSVHSVSGSVHSVNGSVHSVNGSLKGVVSDRDRADRDSNWRNHSSDKEAQANSYLNPNKPPFGSKPKNKQKNKAKPGKPPARSSNNDSSFIKRNSQAKPFRKQDHQTVQGGSSGLETSSVDETCLPTVDNKRPTNSKPCDNDSVLSQRLKPENDNDNKSILNNNKPTPVNPTSSSSLEGNKSESTSVKKSKKKKKRKDRDSVSLTKSPCDSSAAQGNKVAASTPQTTKPASSSSKPNAGNRFSRVAGPHRPNR